MTSARKRIMVMVALRRHRLITPLGFTTGAGWDIFWYNTDDGSTHIVKFLCESTLLL